MGQKPYLDINCHQSSIGLIHSFPFEDYNFTRENARQWPIETTKVPMSYQKMLAAQPFLTQTFVPSLDPSKVPDGKKRRILSLGLHGSTVNNFFANLSTKVCSNLYSFY